MAPARSSISDATGESHDVANGNQRPSAVMAMTRHIKPEIYPKWTTTRRFLLEYPKAQGVVQASWNWPFSRKDLEVYAERGYAIATGGNSLRVAVTRKAGRGSRTGATAGG